MDKEAAVSARATTTRRTAIVALAGGLVALGMMAAPQTGLMRSRTLRRLASRIPGLSGYVSLAHAEMAEWREKAGTLFSTDTGYRLRLAGVRPLQSEGERPAHLRQQAFLAAFDVAGGLAMPGNLIHRLHQPGAPAFDVFFDAPSPGSAGRMYAVFN